MHQKVEGAFGKENVPNTLINDTKKGIFYNIYNIIIYNV